MVDIDTDRFEDTEGAIVDGLDLLFGQQKELRCVDTRTVDPDRCQLLARPGCVRGRGRRTQ
jgi:hypothetical protein